MQYFQPAAPYFVGDCMPFFHDGTFYIYWLQDENHHAGKGGLGGHQWCLSTSRDLVNWTQHGVVLPIDEDWECSICTGSTFFHKGTFYAFYASRKADWSEHISLATSADGINFTKQMPNPMLSSGPMSTGAYRDPFVFRDESTGLFHMIVTTEYKSYPLHNRGGFLDHLISSDLRNWERIEPFQVPGLVGTPECPDHFCWNGWFYLMFSCSGVARYRMSRNPLGPWIRPRIDTLNTFAARVMKTAAFTGGRRIGVSFLPWVNPADNNWQYAGNMYFQEIVQRPDGTLESKFVPEMVPTGGSVLPLKMEPITPAASVEGDYIQLSAPESFASARMENVPFDAHIKLRITPQQVADGYGICLRAGSRYENGAEIRITPAMGTMDLRQAESGMPLPNPHHAVAGVTGLDGPLTLEIVMKGDIIDVCLNNRWCLVHRMPQVKGTSLFLFCQNGSASFESIVINPLS